MGREYIPGMSKSFNPKNGTPEEVERAKQEAIKYRSEIETVFTIEEHKVVEVIEITTRESGVLGVIWFPLQNAWRAQYQKGVKARSKHFPVLSSDSEAIERGRLLAVAQLRLWEQDCAKTLQAKC